MSTIYEIKIVIYEVFYRNTPFLKTRNGVPEIYCPAGLSTTVISVII